MAFADSGLNLQLKNFSQFQSGLKEVTKLNNILNSSLEAAEKNYATLSGRINNTNRVFNTLRGAIGKTETSFRSLTNRVERQNDLFIQTNRGANLAGDSFDLLQDRTEKFGKNVRSLSGDLLDTTNRIKRFGSESKAVSLTNLADSTRTFNRDLSETPSLLERARNGLSGLGSKVSDAASRMKDFSANALSVATKAIAGFGLAATVSLAATVNIARENQSAFASLAKTLDGVSVVGANGLIQLTKEGESLKAAFTELSETIPASFAELSELAGLGSQLGIVEGLGLDEAETSLIAFTKTVSGLAEATDLTAEVAATGLARISNIFTQELSELGLTPGENIEKLGNVIVELGNTMATTESEILNFSTRLAGAGATAGLSQADVFAIGSAFTSVGLTAEAGATSVSRALLGMQEAITTSADGINTIEFSGFLRLVQQTEDGAELTAETFRQLWQEDAGTAFTLFVEGLAKEGDRAGQTLAELGLGSSEAQRTFLAMAGNSDLLSEALLRANMEFENGSALTDEVQQRYATLDSRLTIFKNTISNTASAIGDVFLPSITLLTDAASNVIAVFGDRIPEVLTALGGKFQPLFAEITGGVASVDFTSLLDSGFDRLLESINSFDTTALQTVFNNLSENVFPAINTGISFLIDNWDTLKVIGGNIVWATTATIAIGALTAGITALLSPIGLAIAGVAALGIAWDTNFLGIKETTQTFIQDINEGGLSAALSGIGIPDSVIETGQKFLDGFIQPIKDAIPTIVESVSGLGESISSLIQSEGIQFLIGGAIDSGGGLAAWLTDNSAAIGEFVGVVVTTPIEQLSGFVDIVSSFLDVLSTGASVESVEKLATAFQHFLTLPFDNFGAFLSGDADFSIIETFEGLLDNIDLGLPTIDPERLLMDIGSKAVGIVEAFEGLLEPVDLGLPTIDPERLLMDIGNKAVGIIEAFEGLLESVSLGLPTFPDILGKAREIKDGIIEVFSGLFDGIDLGLPKLPEFITDIDLTPDFIFGSDTSEAEALGKAQQDGIAKGIDDNADEPRNAIQKASDFMSNTWTSYWESESPSRLTERMGQDLIAGWVLGLSDTQLASDSVLALTEVLTASFDNLSQTILNASLPGLDSLKTSFETITATYIPSLNFILDELSHVYLAELANMFLLLSGETIPQYASALYDEAIPATESMIERVNNLINDLNELTGSISETAGVLTGLLSSALKASTKLLEITDTKAESLTKKIKLLAEQYLALAAAITATANAGDGLTNSTPTPPGASSPTPFQKGGSFIVPYNIKPGTKGPTGGMLIEVHSGELIEITPRESVSNQLSIPVDNLFSRSNTPSVSAPSQTGAGIINNITNTTQETTRGGDTFILNLPTPVGGQGEVISNFRLMETLARG